MSYSSLVLSNPNLVAFYRLGEIGGTGGQFSRGYLRLTGQTGNYAATPNSTALSSIGDIDVSVDLALDNWHASGTIIGKSNSTTTWFIHLSAGGSPVIRIDWNASGTLCTDFFSDPVAGSRHTIRVTREASTGIINFYWDGVQIKSVTDTAGSLATNTDAVLIGTRQTASAPILGNYYGATIKNGINGTVVASPDFTAVAAATSVFQDNQLNTWTVNGILARDAKGTNDGLYLPFTAPTTWTGGTLAQTGALTGSGDTDKAAIFNGTTGYSVVGSSVLGSTPSAFSLECWAKGAAQANRNLVALGRSASNAPVIRLGTGSTTSSKLRLRVQNDASTAVKDFESSADAFDGSNFYHLAATYDSTNGAILYVNGVASGSSSGAYSGTINIDRTAIGTLVQAANSGFFSGTIDDAAIYNAALDASTVLAHYNAGIHPSGLGGRRAYGGFGRRAIP